MDKLEIYLTKSYILLTPILYTKGYGMKSLFLVLIASCSLLNISYSYGGTPEAEAKAKTEAENDPSITNELDKIGFGPAFFIVHYDDEVIDDSKDVKLLGDGTVYSKGSNYSANLGLEVHYAFSFWHKVKCKVKVGADCTKSEDYELATGHVVAPFLGVYDVNDGINGIAAGFTYGYWRSNLKDGGKPRTALNVGVGWTVHRNQLVLTQNVKEGMAPPAGLAPEDYTSRKDVNGVILMISANLGF